MSELQRLIGEVALAVAERRRQAAERETQRARERRGRLLVRDPETGRLRWNPCGLTTHGALVAQLAHSFQLTQGGER